MKNTVKGGIFITLGACCYGMLGTYVKMAYHAGFSTAEVTISQFSLGLLGLFIGTTLRPRPAVIAKGGSIRSKARLIVAGSSLGLTSIFYYLSVKYITVSVAIVLLAQSVWMGVVLEAIKQKTIPGIGKLFAVGVIIIGTALATNVLDESLTLNWMGILFGGLGALCYTATMYSTNHLETHFPPLTRSLFMILGGLIVILVAFYRFINSSFSVNIFFSWGLVIAVFGTILPPLLFTRGMPMAGMGLGAILASIEIPIAVIMASLLLGEPVSLGQWIGVTLILGSVIGMNIPKRNSQFKNQNI